MEQGLLFEPNPFFFARGTRVIHVVNYSAIYAAQLSFHNGYRCSPSSSFFHSQVLPKQSNNFLNIKHRKFINLKCRLLPPLRIVELFDLTQENLGDEYFSQSNTGGHSFRLNLFLRKDVHFVAVLQFLCASFQSKQAIEYNSRLQNPLIQTKMESHITDQELTC